MTTESTLIPVCDQCGELLGSALCRGLHAVKAARAEMSAGPRMRFGATVSAADRSERARLAAVLDGCEAALAMAIRESDQDFAARLTEAQISDMADA